MFPSPAMQATSTPFSVKDILSLEQHPGALASLELGVLGGSPSSCMLAAAFKQEAFPSEDPPLPEPPKSSACAPFPASFCGRSYLEMDPAKEPKADRKGRLQFMEIGSEVYTSGKELGTTVVVYWMR